jgi:hypothetical protein
MKFNILFYTLTKGFILCKNIIKNPGENSEGFY